MGAGQGPVLRMRQNAKSCVLEVWARERLYPQRQGRKLLSQVNSFKKWHQIRATSTRNKLTCVVVFVLSDTSPFPPVFDCLFFLSLKIYSFNLTVCSSPSRKNLFSIASCFVLPHLKNNDTTLFLTFPVLGREQSGAVLSRCSCRAFRGERELIFLCENCHYWWFYIYIYIKRKKDYGLFQKKKKKIHLTKKKEHFKERERERERAEQQQQKRGVGGRGGERTKESHKAR